jgi:hypothetical protein
VITDVCSWDHPGSDRYTGNIPAAIAAYGFPVATQQALVAAFEARQFDDRVIITRDEIRGRKVYDPEIRAMHFGSRGIVCRTTTRARWPADHVERALVFCAQGECLAWPSVCGNLFRISVRASQGTLGQGRMPPLDAVGGAPLPLLGIDDVPGGYGPSVSPSMVAFGIPTEFSIVPSPIAGSFAGSVADSAAVVTLVPPLPPAVTLALAPPVQPIPWAVQSAFSPLAVGPQVVTPSVLVPEPATWLSMLGGLAALALVTRRRTR